MSPNVDSVLKLAREVHDSARGGEDCKAAIIDTLELWSRRILLEIAQKVDLQVSTTQIEEMKHNPFALPIFSRENGTVNFSTSSTKPKILDCFERVVENDKEITPKYSQGDSTRRHKNLMQTVHAIFSEIPRTGCLDETKLRRLYSIALQGYQFAGCMAYSLEQYDKSSFFNSVLLIFSPNHTEAMFNQALTMLSNGRSEDAVFWWRRTLEVNPGYVAAAQQLAKVLIRQRRHEEAIKVISTCLKCAHQPKNIQGWQNLLGLYFTLGNLLYVNCKISSAFSVFCHIFVLTHIDLDSVDKPSIETLCETVSTCLVRPETAVNLRYEVYGETGLPELLIRLTQRYSETCLRPIKIVLANSLLSLARIIQHGHSLDSRAANFHDILALYLLSLSVHPSASTANNIGNLLTKLDAGLALQYYKYGLSLDPENPLLHRNLGTCWRSVSVSGISADPLIPNARPQFHALTPVAPAASIAPVACQTSSVTHGHDYMAGQYNGTPSQHDVNK